MFCEYQSLYVYSVRKGINVFLGLLVCQFRISFQNRTYSHMVICGLMFLVHMSSETSGMILSIVGDLGRFI